jgi:N-methylhydantoinase A
MNEKREPAGAYRLGIDIGGTFTDLVLLGANGSVHLAKVVSTPPDFGVGVIRGLQSIVDSTGISPRTIVAVIHGTTVAANAILEGRGAKAALITTRGFRDVLELGRMRYPILYNIMWDKPKPLVPRRLRLELDYRIDSRGELERPLDPLALDALIDKIKEQGVESVAICFINSYLNPELEREIAQRLRSRCPEVFTSASADISPEIREFERTSTTVVNAYVQPLVARYIDDLQKEFAAEHIPGTLQIMQSSGGVVDAAAARSTPVRLIESGPAAGVTATKSLAVQLGLSNLIAFDMGGTTAKGSLIEGGQPFEASEYEVGGGMNTRRGLARGNGYTVRVPSIDIAEVGAGGGSICWIDSGGAPRVGPQSSGAVPGPACYGAGGELPTLTDAQVVLGYLNPKGLAGGVQPINQLRAADAMRERFADPLGLDLLEAAYGVCQIGVVNMSKAVKAVSSERGRDPRDFALVAFGGAGPAYAVEMARTLGMSRVVVPINPGLFSTVGLLVADIQHHTARTYTKRDQLDVEEIARAFAEMEKSLLMDLDQQGYAANDVAFNRSADLHYVGQSSELNVSVPGGEIASSDLASLRERFDIEHERTYGHRGIGQRVELANLRVRATVRVQEKDRFDVFRMAPYAPVSDDAHRPEAETRDAYFGSEHGVMRTPVITRADLSSEWMSGPCIIEDMDATTVIPPGALVRRDKFGNIHIEIAQHE